MLVYGTNDCAGVRDSELRALHEFAAPHPNRHWRYLDACSTLQLGKLIVLAPTDAPGGEWWDAQQEDYVKGVTACDARTIRLGSADWRRDTHAHELAHWLECFLDHTPPDVQHESWPRRGLYDATDRARLRDGG
jgi:hypothetical protein